MAKSPDYKSLVSTAQTTADNAQTTADSKTISTEWVDAGPISIGASTTAPTKGVVVLDSFRWRRVGDSMEILIDYYQSSGGTPGSGEFLFDINAVTGESIDTTKLRASAGVGNLNAILLGGCRAMNTNAPSTTSVAIGNVAYDSGNNVKMMTLDGASNRNYVVGSGNFALAGSIWFNMHFTVPIQGWTATA